MKKLGFLFIFILSSALLLSAQAAEPQDAAGTWEGWYYANQGQTGLTLTMDDNGAGVFEFYNMPGASNAKDGSYTVTAETEGDTLIIKGDEWIDAPSGYSFVTLEGTLNGDVYEGTVDSNESWPFKLIKNNQSYQEVADSVFNNHRYQLFDESLTWEQAKARCEELGGHLVTITSAEEQTFVSRLVTGGEKKQYWIGMSRNDGELSWVTGEDVSYENWSSGEPNRVKRSDDQYEDYVQLFNEPNPAKRSERFQWNDIYNDNSYPNEEDFFSLEHVGFICEWETWSDSAEWSSPELQEASDLGLIPDVLVGKDMTQVINRGEFAAVAVQLFEKMSGGRAVMSSECNFADIDNNENRNYILKAFNIGAVNGMSDTEYAPGSPITREQLATMLCRVYKKVEWPEWTLATDDNYTINYSGVQKFADDADISDYARPSVYFMVKYGVLSGVGDNKFAPKNTNSAQEAVNYANATREQAIVMSLRSYENLSTAE